MIHNYRWIVGAHIPRNSIEIYEFVCGSDTFVLLHLRHEMQFCTESDRENVLFRS